MVPSRRSPGCRKTADRLLGSSPGFGEGVFPLEAVGDGVQEPSAAFGCPAGGRERPAFPKVRVVTIGECGSHAKIAAQMGPVGGKGSCEQALARRMSGRLEEGWLLIADRGFYNWPDWQAAAIGAALLWRVKADLRLPVLDLLPDGSYLSVVAKPTLHDEARNKLIAAARAGERLDPGQAMRVRVIEYEIGDRDGGGSGELIALITTITDPALASAAELARAYCQRWEEETGNDQLKTCLRGPGSVLRSKSPDMVRQEIYGYLLTHYAISALICQAATEADVDPDRVKFLRTAGPLTRPFPLTRPGDPPPRSWLTSPARATSTPPGGTAPTPRRPPRPAQLLQGQTAR
jgi:hypothetical protein